MIILPLSRGGCRRLCRRSSRSPVPKVALAYQLSTALAGCSPAVANPRCRQPTPGHDLDQQAAGIYPKLKCLHAHGRFFDMHACPTSTTPLQRPPHQPALLRALLCALAQLQILRHELDLMPYLAIAIAVQRLASHSSCTSRAHRWRDRQHTNAPAVCRHLRHLPYSRYPGTRSRNCPRAQALAAPAGTPAASFLTAATNAPAHVHLNTTHSKKR